MLIINLEDRKFYQRSKTARNAKYKLYSSEAQYLKCKKEKKNHNLMVGSYLFKRSLSSTGEKVRPVRKPVQQSRGKIM